MNNWEVLRQNSAQQFAYNISGVPTSPATTVTRAYWMLKNSLSDNDTAALITISITESMEAEGYITNGDNDGTANLTFLLDDTALSALDPTKTYYRSVKTILSNGNSSAPADADAPVRLIAAGIQKLS